MTLADGKPNSSPAAWLWQIICSNFIPTIFIFAPCLTQLSSAFAQTLEVLVRSQEALADTEHIFITGNQPQLGNWNPGTIKLQRQADSLWIGRFDFSAGTPIEFKLTLGSWNREALDAQRRVPPNSRLVVQRDTTVFIRVPAWKKTALYVGKVTGDVRYHKNFHSAKLGNDRDLIVWLPPDYQKKKSRRYPVLYAHDGQNLFDPRTSFAGVDWAVDETADSLIRAGKMQPVIIVGIANTADRVNEYTSAKGRDYAAFLIDEVKPFIDKNYRTLPDRNHTAVMGSSLGGLISLYLASEHPEVFSMAACLSGSWNWDNAAAFQLVESETASIPNIKLYLDHGSEGDEGRIAWMYRSLRDTLIGRGFVLGKNLEYSFGIGDAHHESAWARRVWRPLLFFFGK